MASGDESQPRRNGRASERIAGRRAPAPGGRVRESDALAERFLELAARLQGAVRPLRARGTLPQRSQLDELATCRRDFLALRDRARQLAESFRIPCPPAEELDDLRGLADLLDDLADAEGRRAVGEEVLRPALAVLDRVLALAHASRPDFPPLLDCQERARRLAATLAEGLTERVRAEAESLAGGSHPFACLLRLVEERGSLDDERWAALFLAVGDAFGKLLAAAASHGAIVRRDRRAEASPACEGLAPRPPAQDPVLVPPIGGVNAGPLALSMAHPMPIFPGWRRELGRAFPAFPVAGPRPPTQALRGPDDSFQPLS